MDRIRARYQALRLAVGLPLGIAAATSAASGVSHVAGGNSVAAYVFFGVAGAFLIAAGSVWLVNAIVDHVVAQIGADDKNARPEPRRRDELRRGAESQGVWPSAAALLRSGNAHRSKGQVLVDFIADGIISEEWNSVYVHSPSPASLPPGMPAAISDAVWALIHEQSR